MSPRRAPWYVLQPESAAWYPGQSRVPQYVTSTHLPPLPTDPLPSCTSWYCATPPPSGLAQRGGWGAALDGVARAPRASECRAAQERAARAARSRGHGKGGGARPCEGRSW